MSAACPVEQHSQAVVIRTSCSGECRPLEQVPAEYERNIYFGKRHQSCIRIVHSGTVQVGELMHLTSTVLPIIITYHTGFSDASGTSSSSSGDGRLAEDLAEAGKPLEFVPSADATRRLLEVGRHDRDERRKLLNENVCHPLRLQKRAHVSACHIQGSS